LAPSAIFQYGGRAQFFTKYILNFLIYRLKMADARHFKIFKIFNMAPTAAIFQYGS